MIPQRLTPSHLKPPSDDQTALTTCPDAREAALASPQSITHFPQTAFRVARIGAPREYARLRLASAQPLDSLCHWQSDLLAPCFRQMRELDPASPAPGADQDFPPRSLEESGAEVPPLQLLLDQTSAVQPAHSRAQGQILSAIENAFQFASGADTGIFNSSIVACFFAIRTPLRTAAA